VISRVLTALVLSMPLIAAYGIFAIGIVLIYRASRVLNLAHGAMAMLPAYLLYALSEMGLPVLAAFPLALATGGGLGWGVERVFVRRLREESLTAQTVGTVAALGILVAAVAKIWGTASLRAVGIFPEGHLNVSRSIIRYGELGLFAVMLVVAAVLFTLLSRTDLGLMMRGSAESRLAASLMGVNPDRMISLTWVIGGTLAALAGILLAAVTSLHPYALSLAALPAFIAALIGGLGSLPGALAGAAVVGAVQGLVPILGGLGDAQGAPQLLLALLAIGAMVARGRALVGAEH
jgi:branched-chain amino acid transport system permease protein